MKNNIKTIISLVFVVLILVFIAFLISGKEVRTLTANNHTKSKKVIDDPDSLIYTIFENDLLVYCYTSNKNFSNNTELM